MTGAVVMVRPHDLRPGDRIVVEGAVVELGSPVLPAFTSRSHRMVAVTVEGRRVSWSMDEARWPVVELVARADRRVA